MLHSARIDRVRAPRNGRCQAFSLVELLVVMALIVVMFVMLHSRGSGSYQTQRKEQCRQNLVAQFKALSTFALEHEGRYPVVTNVADGPDAGFAQLVPTCTTDTKIFICPGSKDSALTPARPFFGQPISYAFYSGRKEGDAGGLPLASDRQVDGRAKEARQPLFSASGQGPGSNHERFGGNVLWVDGRVSASGTNASEALPIGPGARLVNPPH